MNPKIITIRGKKFRQFEIVELDVWGNAREGFDINNLYKSGVYISLPMEFGSADVILALKRAGWMKQGIHHKSVHVDGDFETFIFIEHAKTGEPACQLHAVYDNEGTP